MFKNQFYDIIMFGGGAGSSSALINYLEKFQQFKINKKINIAIIDKDLENFPGGIAYGKKLSSNGFFNNPCRLSPVDFIKWTIEKKKRISLINFLKKQENSVIKTWLVDNKKIYLKAKKISDINEMYLPRIFFNFWLEEKLKKLLEKKKYKINLFLFEGEIISLKKKDNKIILKAKKKLKLYDLIFKKNLVFPISAKSKKFLEINKEIIGKFVFTCLGLPPPKQIVNKKILSNKFYIHDLYESGGSTKLLQLIKIKLMKKKKIIIHFLGSKAGFLECLPELNHLIKKKSLNLKIISSSSNAEILNSATLSYKWKSYKLKFLNSNNRKNITNSLKILENIINEFKNATQLGYYKYDAWTQILSTQILNKIISNFSKKELKNYNENFYEKIRNITRFTYPLTVSTKISLENERIIQMNKGKIKKVFFNNGIFNTIIKDNNQLSKKIKSDILICVLGPDAPSHYMRANKALDDLNKFNKIKINKDGLLVDKYFRLYNQKNIYLTGFHASGYNQKRETVIKAITKNSIIASEHLFNVTTK